MIQRIIMFLLAGVLLCAVNFVSGNVIGGLNAIQGQFSAHVHIAPTNLPLCGGVVLNQNHILTSASCVLQAPANTLPQPHIFNIRVGWTGAYQQFTGIRLYVHPLYNPGTFDNDIAVIRLQQNIIFQNLLNAPVAVANVTSNVFADNTPCQIPSYTIAAPAVQQFINIPIMNRGTCNAQNALQNRVLPNQICAGNLIGSPGVCIAARGSGLYCGNELVGILANNFACGTANIGPGIYTQVRLYQEWIAQQFVRQDIPAVGPTPHPSFPIIPITGSGSTIIASLFLFIISFLITVF